MKNVVGSSNRKMKRDWMVLLLFVMMLFLLMNYSINKGRMSLPGVTNRILDNIVTNDVYFEYMVTHYGLPRSAKECPHKKLWDSCTRNLSDFYPWVKQKSRNAYTKFLIRHPKYVANIIFREWIPTLQGEVGYKGDVEVHKAEDSPGTEVVTLFPYFGNKSYYAFTKRIMQKSFKITYGNYIGSFQKNHRFIVSLIPIFVFSLIIILFKFYKRNMLIMYPPILLFWLSWRHTSSVHLSHNRGHQV